MYRLSAKKVAVVVRWPLVELPLYLFLLSYFLLYIFFSFVTVQHACARTCVRVLFLLGLFLTQGY